MSLAWYSDPLHPLPVAEKASAPTFPDAAIFRDGKRTMAPKNVDPDAILSNMPNKVFRDETHFSEYVQVREMSGQEGIFRLLKKAGSGSLMKACQEGPWDFHRYDCARYLVLLVMSS